MRLLHLCDERRDLAAQSPARLHWRRGDVRYLAPCHFEFTRSFYHNESRAQAFQLKKTRVQLQAWLGINVRGYLHKATPSLDGFIFYCASSVHVPALALQRDDRTGRQYLQLSHRQTILGTVGSAGLPTGETGSKCCPRFDVRNPEKRRETCR